MALLPWEGDGCLLWLDGEVLAASKRLGGLAEPLAPPRPRCAGEGERRLAAEAGDRASLPGRLEGNMGLLRCLCMGDVEDGGVRLFWAGGELLRLGDLETRRLEAGGEPLAGEPDILLFCGGTGEGLYRRWMGGE